MGLSGGPPRLPEGKRGGNRAKLEPCGLTLFSPLSVRVAIFSSVLYTGTPHKISFEKGSCCLKKGLKILMKV